LIMHQQNLVKGLQQLSGSLEELFSQIQTDTTWRPRENMRTLLELANHLAQIPALDLAILQGSSEPAVRAMESTLTVLDPSELIHTWHLGLARVTEYFNGLTEEEFEQKVSTAFYGHKATQAEWLLEIITHTYHHRAQLFTYLKLLGRPVDMFTLYA
jgi:uncharacterized damage-inducible protein DinB